MRQPWGLLSRNLVYGLDRYQGLLLRRIIGRNIQVKVLYSRSVPWHPLHNGIHIDSCNRNLFHIFSCKNAGHYEIQHKQPLRDRNSGNNWEWCNNPRGMRGHKYGCCHSPYLSSSRRLSNCHSPQWLPRPGGLSESQFSSYQSCLSEGGMLRPSSPFVNTPGPNK